MQTLAELRQLPPSDLNFLLFHGESSPFSQWAPYGFDLDSVRYPTAEHYMMAEKARTFGDAEALRQVLEDPRPEAAKRLGRQVQGYSDEVWRARRLGIVVRGNLAKFGAHPLLRALLLDTGDKVLAEASRTDLAWGIGWSERDWQSRVPAQWRGENLLGFALMEVRAQLRGRP